MFTLALLILSPSMASTSHVLGKRIDEVTLQAVEGDVRVVVDPEARRIEIDTVDHRPGHTCSFQRVEAGRTATITFGPKALESATDCRMDFTIRLRPEVQLSVDLGLGRIDVRDVATDLKISVHQGDVHLTDVGAVTLAVGEGDVALDNVDGPTVITVDKGHLHGSQTGALTASVREGQNWKYPARVSLCAGGRTASQRGHGQYRRRSSSRNHGPFGPHFSPGIGHVRTSSRQ